MRLHTDFARAFTDGATFIAKGGGRLRLEVTTVGMVSLPTGRVVVGYPDDPHQMLVLARPVRPGRYPVEVAMAYNESGIRVPAAARLRIASTAAVRWVDAFAEIAWRVLEAERASLGIGDARSAHPLTDGEARLAHIGALSRVAFVDRGALQNLVAKSPLEPPPDVAADPLTLLLRTIEASREPMLEELKAELSSELDQLAKAGRIIELSDGTAVAAFPSCSGGGHVAVHWGLDGRGDVAEVDVDLNGLVENDEGVTTLELTTLTSGEITLALEDGRTCTANVEVRSDADGGRIVRVSRGRGCEVVLSGHRSCRASSEQPFVEYAFAPDVRRVAVRIHFGLMRMREGVRS
jgi:Protein of unknown function (DUF4241)